MRKLLPLLLIGFVIAGCGASKDDSGSSKTLKIVFIPKSTGNNYFTEMNHGFEDACKELGCEFATMGPAKADATSQISFIKEQVQRNVDVIAISPNSPDALNTALDEAKAKGILVITADADLTGNEGHRDASVLAPDATMIGQAQVELLGSQINYQGQFAILSATRTAPNQNAWIKAMQETLKQPKYARMKLVEIAYGDDEAQKSTTETDALITKHPALRGIISPTTAGIAAAAQEIEIRGVYPGGPHAVGGGLMLTGLGTPNQMRAFVEKGVVKAFQLWSPRDMGYIACNMAYQLKTGKLKAAEGNKFAATKLGERSFEKNNVVISGPLVTFDKSNIDKYNF